MRKNWLIALFGAALLAIVPASALAQGHHARHHAKRHHQVRTHLRHITAADSGTAGSTGTGTSSTDNDLNCESASTQASDESGSMQPDLSRDSGDDQNSGDQSSSSGQADQADQGDQTDQADQTDQGDQGDEAGCTSSS